MEAKQTFFLWIWYSQYIYIYMLDVAGFTVVMAIFELEDAIYTCQKNVLV